MARLSRRGSYGQRRSAPVGISTLGVTGNGTDETTAVQAALDATTAGKTLDLQGLVISHAGVIKANNAGMRIIGPGEFRAMTPATCSLIVAANNVTIENVLLNLPVQHTVTITGAPTAGTFTLTFRGQTTGAIARNATAATVQAALVALSNVGAGNVLVAGGPGPATPWTVMWLGTYANSNVLFSDLSATSSLTGGTAPAIAVTLDRISTPRNSHRLTLDGVSGAVLRKVVSRGSAATGIRIGGTGTPNPSSYFLLEDCQVDWSRADGIHFTDSSHNGFNLNPTVNGNGDDSISVVSYDNDTFGPCYGIAIIGARVSNSTPKGRGLTVVGGHDILWDDFVVTNPNGAGIYIGCETGTFNTDNVAAITYRNGTIIGASQAVVYGAIMISNVRAAVDNKTIDDILIENVTIVDTLATTSGGATVNRQTRWTNNPGPVSRICARGIEVTRGPNTIFTTDLPVAGYRNSGWTRNGAPTIADVGSYVPIR